MASAMTPDDSAASCSRRDATMESFATSAMTAPRPPWRSPSSKQASNCLSSPASTQISRSGESPACISAGAKRSRRVRHQSTGPAVRAAIPAAKSAAIAPSTAPLPPPVTSCRLPRASPPSGRTRSISATPKGRTPRAAPCPPSRRPMRSRSSEMTVRCTGSGMDEHMGEHLRLAVGFRVDGRSIGRLFFICSHSAKESTGVFAGK